MKSELTHNIISTGSEGNAVVINDVVLLDCGVRFKALSSVYKNLKLVSDRTNKTLNPKKAWNSSQIGRILRLLLE